MRNRMCPMESLMETLWSQFWRLQEPSKFRSHEEFVANNRQLVEERGVKIVG